MKDSYQGYIQYFEKVYDTMDKNYYQPVSRDIFNQFVDKFKTKIYNQLQKTGKSDDFVRWRSASLLIQDLKSEEDVFSEFYPPKPAEEFKQAALGVKMDLGIEGELTEGGFKATLVEPRSDAYEKGLRIDDIILKIDKKDIKKLKEGEIKELLNPLIESKVLLEYFSSQDKLNKQVEIVSKEYFKQTVFMVPVKTPLIYCLEIRHFNQKTSDDLFRYINFFRQHGPMKGLILDLRGNPGGPPLAAREISSFFLTPGEKFAYFQRKGEVQDMLDVPFIPPQYHYDGPIVILINKGSGSAAELFSGVLQSRGRAILMGTNSAGQVMLKSMFDLEDKSMVLLVTARGHKPDGSVFSFNGVVPDRFFKDGENIDWVDYATQYLIYVNEHPGVKLTHG